MATTQQSVVLRLRAAGCVFAEDEARLLLETAATATDLETLVARRVAGEPLEQLLGWAAFAVAMPVELIASDVEPAAVVCARRNLPAAGVYEGDLFAALPMDLRGRVDVLVANVPYVPTA